MAVEFKDSQLVLLECFREEHSLMLLEISSWKMPMQMHWSNLGMTWRVFLNKLVDFSFFYNSFQEVFFMDLIIDIDMDHTL